MAPGRSEGMLPRKIFENINALMAILGQVLFEQSLRKTSLKFFAPNSDSFTKYMIHFVRAFSIYVRLRRKSYCY